MFMEHFIEKFNLNLLHNAIINTYRVINIVCFERTGCSWRWLWI